MRPQAEYDGASNAPALTKEELLHRSLADQSNWDYITNSDSVKQKTDKPQYWLRISRTFPLFLTRYLFFRLAWFAAIRPFILKFIDTAAGGN